MGTRIEWTPAILARMRVMRAERASWDAVGQDLKVGASTALAKWRAEYGGHFLMTSAAEPAERNTERPAMRAGHDVSWGALQALLHPDNRAEFKL